MFNVETTYKYSNIIAFLCSVFLMGTWVSNAVSWWLPFVVMLIPTVLFLLFIVGALAWSFYLTKEE